MTRTASPMRFFRVPVTAITDLTPSFRRFTFGGPDLADYGDPGFDQRIKVVFPTANVGLDAMPDCDDWYTQWREMPEEERPPFRTYTTRQVRNDVHEVTSTWSRTTCWARRPRGSRGRPSATRC